MNELMHVSERRTCISALILIGKEPVGMINDEACQASQGKSRQ